MDSFSLSTPTSIKETLNSFSVSVQPLISQPSSTSNFLRQFQAAAFSLSPMPMISTRINSIDASSLSLSFGIASEFILSLRIEFMRNNNNNNNECNLSQIDQQILNQQLEAGLMKPISSSVALCQGNGLQMKNNNGVTALPYASFSHFISFYQKSDKLIIKVTADTHLCTVEHSLCVQFASFAYKPLMYHQSNSIFASITGASQNILNNNNTKNTTNNNNNNNMMLLLQQQQLQQQYQLQQIQTQQQQQQQQQQQLPTLIAPVKTESIDDRSSTKSMSPPACGYRANSIFGSRLGSISIDTTFSKQSELSPQLHASNLKKTISKPSISMNEESVPLSAATSSSSSSSSSSSQSQSSEHQAQFEPQLIKQSQEVKSVTATAAAAPKRKRMSSANGMFDKKNVVKNFVKAFDSFFMDRRRDSEFIMRFGYTKDSLTKVREVYEGILKTMKFNNKMIIALIYSEVKDVFEFYLRTDARAWIMHSSVFDKRAHQAILSDYLRAVENPREIPKIVNLRVRNRDTTKQSNCPLN